MSTDVAAVFSMRQNRQNIERCHGGAKRFNRLQTGFFPGFPAGNLQQVGFAVSMAASPAPGVVDIMMDEEYFI